MPLWLAENFASHVKAEIEFRRAANVKKLIWPSGVFAGLQAL